MYLSNLCAVFAQVVTHECFGFECGSAKINVCLQIQFFLSKLCFLVSKRIWKETKCIVIGIGGSLKLLQQLKQTIACLFTFERRGLWKLLLSPKFVACVAWTFPETIDEERSYTLSLHDVNFVRFPIFIVGIARAIVCRVCRDTFTFYWLIDDAVLLRIRIEIVRERNSVALMEALKFFNWLHYQMSIEIEILIECWIMQQIWIVSVLNSNFQIDKTVIEKCKNCFVASQLNWEIENKKQSKEFNAFRLFAVENSIQRRALSIGWRVFVVSRRGNSQGKHEPSRLLFRHRNFAVQRLQLSFPSI